MDYDKKKRAGDTARAREYKKLIDRIGADEFIKQSINHSGDVAKLRELCYSGGLKDDEGSTSVLSD